MTMSIGFCLRRAVVAGACMLAAANLAAAQESVEQFYKGKQLQIVVGSSAGGGYDTYARLLARHLGDHIPGNPAVVVQNMSGAGSNRAAGYIYSVAPKDGTVAGAIFPGAILQPLLGGPPVQHEPAKFLYLGNANSDVYVCFARADAPVKDFKDALSTELIVGASGDGATTRDFPVMLNNLLGAKFKLVMGYPGSREIALAMERGEVQGVCGIGWTGIEILYPEWFAKGTIKPLVQLSVKGHRDLHARKVPTTLEFARNADERSVMELIYSQGVFGRPFVLPPGVPADRVAALRKAFMATFADPRLLAEAKKMNFDIEPMSGEDMQALVARLYATPANVVEKAKQALTAKPLR
jgi:tripartite-type tricarboxylate transporter receptor subunit TctC